MTAKEAVEKIVDKLYILMEEDNRTMEKPITDNGKYYNKLVKELKIVDEYAKQVTQ